MPDTALPLFYSRPAPLTAQRHANRSITPISHFAFARKTNSLPLSAIEVPLASLDYPVVFVRRGDDVILAAVMGLRQDENLFVGEDGSWKPGTYIPAYVRRYPFILFEDAQANTLTLCVDEAAESLTESDGNPLFKDGEPTAATQRAIDFCRDYHQQMERSRPFCQAVLAAGLLEDSRAELQLPSGDKIALDGMLRVNEDKLRALPDETIVEWHRNGWTALLHAHLLSLARFNLLGAEASKA